MFGKYFLLFVLGGILLYFFLKRLFTKGNIENVFFIDRKDEFALYQYVDHYAWNWSRSGSYETHRYKLRKIDLDTFDSVYYKNITSFASGLLHGGASIIGFNDKYIFININENDLAVFDICSGENIASKREILNANSDVSYFDINDIVYSNILNTIILYDQNGDSRYLNPQDLNLIKLNRKIKKNEIDKHFFSIKDLPIVDFHKLNFMSKQNGCYFFPEYPVVNTILKSGSTKYFIHISKSEIEDEESINKSLLKNDFLCPVILSYDCKEAPYVIFPDEEPILIVLHIQRYNPAPGDVLISAVKGNSEIIWTKKMSEIFINPQFSDSSKIAYYELNSSLIFMMINGKGGFKMCLSEINKTNGDLIKKPVQHINMFIPF